MPWLLLIFFPAGLVLVGLFLPFFIARQYSTRYARAYENFYVQNREFTRLKMDFERKNLEWLIGVRPVLYTDIDRLAQICFARAYYVTTQGIDLKNSLINRLPGISSTWQQALDFRSNLKAISRFRKVLENFTVFSNQVNELAGYRQELDDLPQQLKQKKNTTESQLSRLVPEVGKAENKLKDLETRYRSQVSDGIRWTVDAARKALDSANASIVDSHQETDDFAYASAHIFVVIAYNLLDMFWLFTESLIVPPRYQLDHFCQTLDSVSEKLRQILILKPPKNGNSLNQAQSYLNSSSAKLKKARSSLDDAHLKIQRVEAFERDLQEIDLPGLLVGTRNLQDECEGYWGTVQEDPQYWRVALPEGMLPLERLETANRNYYQPWIAPKQMTANGNQVHLKQSEIPSYLGAIEKFLGEVALALQEVQSLDTELARHKQLQMEVLTRLSEEGDAYEAVRQLEEARQYSSDEIIARCVELENRFQQFELRAKKIRGANFPVFVTELNEFVLECRQFKSQHEQIIFEYQRLAQGIYDQLQAAHGEILNKQIEQPVLEWDWTLRINEITQLSNPQILESRQFTQLRDFINAGEVVLQNTDQDQEKFQGEYSRCQSVYQDIFLNLQNIQEEILLREEEVSRGWAWIYATLDDDLLHATASVNQLRQEWEAAWNLAKMSDVLAKCDQIKTASAKILVDLDLRIQETELQQREFNTKYNIVEAAFQSPAKYGLDQYEGGQELLSQLVSLIRDERDPGIVDWALGEARRVINQAKRNRLEQATVYLLLTQIKSGQYKRNATYTFNVGDISAGGEVNIAGGNIKKPGKGP